MEKKPTSFTSSALKTDDYAASSQPPAPPPHKQTFGYSGTHVVANAVGRRGWRPEPGGGRHDSPLFGRHRKRPSFIDSNESEAAVNPKDLQETRAEQLSPSTELEATPVPPLALTSAINTGLLSVQPPRTPQGRATYTTFDDGGLSAAQRVRMELTAHSGSRAASGSRANSSEDIFASNSVTYDEKNGPRSCPSTFNDGSRIKTKLSPGTRRHVRGGDLIVSKLLPTRDSVNSLLTYLHELQISEASLRKQLVTTKRHTEEELYESLSKLNELQRTMQEVERDRQIAQQRLEEKEQRIRELAAKLEKAEKTEAKSSPSNDGLPPIAEEGISHTDARVCAETTEQHTLLHEARELKTSLEEAPALTMEEFLPSTQSNQYTATPLRPSRLQCIQDESTQFAIMSPRSPNRPLWDPWASGGATPMKNLPPVFTIGPTGLNSMVTTLPGSAEQSAMTNVEDYELKSVLMPPRRVHGHVEASENTDESRQVMKQYASSAPPLDQQDTDFVDMQHSVPVFNLDSAPPPPLCLLQQEITSTKSQNANYGAEVYEQEMLSTTEISSPNDPMLHVGVMPPIYESPYEQENIPASLGDDVNQTKCNGRHPQQEEQTSADSLVPPVRDTVEGNKDMVPPQHLPEHSTVSPSMQTLDGNDQRRHDTSEVAATLKNENIEVAQSEQSSNAEAEKAGSGSPSALSLGSSPPLPLPTSQDHTPRPATPSQNEQDNKPMPVEPVSLETLLVDFFTEVDKKRLKMAKVYGKRYAGREKWLFAELTKRYGAVKVAALKARFENGSSGDVSTATSNDGGDKSDPHPAQSSNASDHPKVGRQGHPRHPQFFHPPTPASSVDLSAGMPPVPPPVSQPEENETSSSQSQQEAEGAGTPPTPSGNVSSVHADRVSPRQRHKAGNISAFSGPLPSMPTRQEIDEGNSVTTVGTDGPPQMNGPPRPTQREERPGQFNPPPPPPPGRMDNNNAAPLGLRQRHNASGPTPQGHKNASTEPPAVTLEGLLKELYKTHQPDKLKNVSIVAKQYAGKERELVGLLKGKYGALSVKRLEENLEVLERAHRSRMDGKNIGKKRGCFVRTISLVFWLSVLLYFSFGAVFVSFVVLDAWECHGVDSDDQELDSEECLPLKQELETFTYERVADYMSQSHSDACFCSEWKARESALFSNLSGDDLLNLARLVPFSPESFGAPWIISVKEQVPSQEFYDSYAKPVVDLSLDVSSFVWSSVLELAGYDEVSDEKIDVMENNVENDAADIPSFDEGSESDADTDLLEQLADEIENESFVSEVEAITELAEEVEAEVKADAEVGEVFVSFGQVPVEEKATALDDESRTGESGIVMDEDVFVENTTPADDETASVSEESSSFEAVDEHTTVELTDPLESEDIPVEEPEPANTAEAEPVEFTETEASDILTGDDTVITESADDGGISEAEVHAVAVTIDGVEEVSEVVVEGNGDASDDENTAESEDIVEVEIHQEGLELSYPETETTEEDQHVESDVLPSGGLDEGTESEFGGDVEDLSSASNEAETEVVAESEDVSVDGVKEGSEPMADAVDEDLAAPSDGDVEVTDTESDVEAGNEAFEAEVDIVDEKLVTSGDVEVEISPEASVESEFVEDDDGIESSTPDDADVFVLESEDGESGDSSPSETVEVEGEGEDSILTGAEQETPVEVIASKRVMLMYWKENRSRLGYRPARAMSIQ